jgi:inner membrane protein
MASIGHVIVGIAGARLLTSADSTRGERLGLALALSALSLAPDADVIAFALRIPYAAEWGHRGASHSVALAVAAGLLCGLALGRARGRLLASILVCCGVAVSHGLLDALTDGGLGAALLWPWTRARYFFPLRPLPVAPIGLHLLSPRGLSVLLRETLYFLPLLLWALLPHRRIRRSESR